MKQRLLAFITFIMIGALLALGLALAAGCGGQSPSDVVSSFVNDINNQDYGAAYDLLSQDSPIRKIPRDQFIDNAEKSQPPDTQLVDFAVKSENIQDDNTATVEWTGTERVPNTPDNPLDVTYTLVKEDDAWKIKQ